MNNEKNNSVSPLKSIFNYFEEQASSSPKKIALITAESTISYAELLEKVDQLAQYLSNNGVIKGSVVSILLERSAEFVISCLAILKVGAIYVPVNANYSTSYISNILKKSDSSLLITNSTLYKKNKTETIHVLHLDTTLLKSDPKNNLSSIYNNESYVIYTSGSTGEPKGVISTQSAMINRFKWVWNHYPFKTNDICCLKAPVHFVDSVGEMFIPLLKGIPLVILPPKMEFDSQQFIEYLAQHQVTRLVIVPSQLQLILDTCSNLAEIIPSLNHIEISGEGLSTKLALNLKKIVPKAKLLNRYGSSEYTSSIFFEINKLNKKNSWVPIGKPIHNTKIYILNEHLSPVSAGETGTLWMSGLGISPGYLNNEELSSQKFKLNPFFNAQIDDPWYEKIYNTGDLVRLNKNNELEHKGRADYQVSLYGNRFELAEVESHLNQHPNIKNSVVVLSSSDVFQYLTAYVMTNTPDLQFSEIRQFLQRNIPSYMIPSALIKLESFPLLSNGKIDRQKLLSINNEVHKETAAAKDDVTSFLLNQCKILLPKNESGEQQSFFELGFNSLMLMSLAISVQNHFKIPCTINDLYKNDTIPKLVNYIKDSCKEKQDSKKTFFTPPASDEINLSQKRFWLLEKGVSGNLSPYHIPVLININGAISLKKLNQCLNEIIKENPNLSSHFKVINNKIKLVTHNLDWQLEQVVAQEKELDQLIFHSLHQRFDLENDFLIRGHVFKISPQKCILSLAIHHIIFDGWSQQHFTRLIFQKYNKESRTDNLTIKKKQISIPSKQLIQLFKQQLETIAPLPLPYDSSPRKKTPVPSSFIGESNINPSENAGSRYSFVMSPSQVAAIKELAKANKSTLYVCLLSVFSVLLGRYCQKNSFSIGTVISIRDQIEMSCAINTLPLSLNFSWHDDYLKFMNNISDQFYDLYTIGEYNIHSDTELSQFQLNAESNLNTFFIFEKKDEMPSLRLGSASCELPPHPIQLSKSELTLHIEEYNDHLNCYFEFPTQLFTLSKIKNVASNFIFLAENIVKNPKKSLYQYDILANEEYRELLLWNNTSVIKEFKTLDQLLVQRVLAAANEIAVIDHDHQPYTYAFIHEKSDQLAAQLKIHQSNLMGIAIDPGINMVIGLFAILKANAAFLPLDTRQPEKRLHYMLEDSNVKIVLTEKQHIPLLSQSAPKEIQIVAIETLLANKPIPLSSRQNSIDDLAYVLYTSGSTGHPKGVKGTHKALLNRLEWMWDTFPFQDNDRCCQKTALSFVDSLWELFGPILKGVPLYLTSLEQRLSIELLTNSLIDNQVSWLILTPSWLQVLLDYMQAKQLKLDKMRVCVTSGETIYSHLFAPFKSCFPQAKLLNLYGSTEVAADACFFDIDLNNTQQHTIPIGRPIDNLHAFVLDQFDKFLPIGVQGELCIAGEGLAQGYLDEHLTSKKFVTIDIEKNPVRIFKTGDLALWREDGNLILAGRNDSQIKINGIRLDLSEIEVLLLNHPLIQNAIVLSTGKDQQQLMAFIQTKEKKLVTLDVQKYLGSYLPQLFIPSFIYIYEQFPKTISGKINRIELIKHHESQYELKEEKNYNVTETESIILDLYQEILNLTCVNIQQNFFHSGGNSLTAMALIYKLNGIFNTQFDIADIFNNPTAYELAKKIENQNVPVALLPPITKTTLKKQVHLASSSQRRIWYAAKMQEALPWSFNVPLVITIKGQLNISALEQSINQIIKENTIYSVNFVFTNGMLYQKSLNKKLQINTVQIKNKNSSALIKKYATRVFDLENDLLIDVTLFQLSTSQFKLLINHHHIITDAWSLNVFLKKLENHYQLFSKNKDYTYSEAIETSAINYIDFSNWQNQLLMKQSWTEQLNYWKKQLEHCKSTTFRRDKCSDPAESLYQGARFQLNISQEDTQKLHQFSRKNQVSLSMVLLTVLNLITAKYSGKEDIVIGMPVANRKSSILEDMLGAFINTVAIRTQINPNGCFLDALNAVKTNYINALKNQDIPLEYLMESLNIHLPYQIGFDYINQTQQYSINLDQLACTIDYVYLGIAQCDLTLFANEKSNGLILLFEYKSELYTTEYIEQLALKYRELINQIINENHVSEPVQWLSDQEEIVRLGQGIKSNKTQPVSVMDAIEKHAREMPLNKAIHTDYESLNYRDLYNRVHQLADTLGNKLNSESRPLKIATCLPEKADWIISILAIWKLNACYVPLNPEQPVQRIHSSFKQVQADLIITDLFKAHELDLEQEKIFCLDEMNWESGEVIINKNNQKEMNPYSYIIFTSGTTGLPKPVPTRENALLNVAYSQIEGFKIKPESNILQFAPCSFDASLSEITTAFLSGATLYLMPEHLRKDAIALSDYINQNEIDVATLPPSFLATIPKDKPLSLKTLIIAGEACDTDSFYFWSKNRVLINAYGPTEAAICATYKHANHDVLPGNIGKPLANIELYVLDEHQKLLPKGAEGELYIGGEQLTDGYINHSESAAKFHHIFLDSKKRIYQTGDKVRWLMNGDLEFLGRIDRQIKYHGIRIEPQEIEQKITSIPFVQENAVMLQDNDQLIAFIALDSNHFTQTNELELWPSLAEFYVYDEFIYNIMTNDLKRNYFYQNSLNKLAVNKIVLDIGTGKDAILARLAINAGAKKVYAIEYLESTYNYAKRTIEKLNLTDRIILIHGDSRTINLPEHVDVIVSEIVGSLGGSEGAAVILNDAKKRFLKSGGVLIPDQAITKIAAVSLPDEFLQQAGFGPLAGLYAEKIYSDFNYEFLPRICIKNINPDYLISDAAVLEHLPFNSDFKTENKETTLLTIDQDAKFSGFIAWLNLFDEAGNHLDILKDNHCWVPVYFPALHNELRVKKGDVIHMSCEYRLCDNKLNPDYIVQAKIWRDNNLVITITYDSLHFHPINQSNPFYDNLFKNQQVTLSKTFTQSQFIQFIKQQLSQQLPSYMVPKKYIFVDKLPLTQHGKIDYHQLIRLDELQNDTESVIEEPQTELEIKLGTIWSKFLPITDIDRNSNFFHLGGDSILAIQVISEIQNEGFTVTVQELYTYPSIATLAQWISTQTARKQIAPVNVPLIPNLQSEKRSRESISSYPLSPVQKNMLSINLTYPNSDVYLTQVYWHVHFINVALYKKAWELLIADTEVLRSSFVWPATKEPQQIIHKRVNVTWRIIDWSMFSELENRSKLTSYLFEDRAEHFNLENPSPIRITLIKIKSDEYIILWTHHHIILDGWSLPILLDKLDLYYQYLEGKKEKPAPNHHQFSSYIEWLTQQNKEVALSFWKQKLQGIGYPTAITLTKKPLIKYNINSVYTSSTDYLSEDITKQLKQFSQAQGITMNTLLQMTWALLLANYSGQKNVVFGTTVSGRSVGINNIDKIPGLLINTIPVHIKLNDDDSILSCMQKLQQYIHESQSYGYVGLHEIKKVIDWEQTLPIFYSLTLFENYPSKLKNKLHFVEKTNFPLVVSFSLSEQLHIDLTYATEYFTAASIAKIIKHIKKVLLLITHDFNQKIKELSIISKAELKLLEKWNKTARETPPLTIHHLFEKVAKRYPNHIALCQGKNKLTYEELDRKSNQFACYLHQYYAEKYQRNFSLETIIAIYLPRGIDLYVSILGILKAGGCYVPLDPSYPKERNDFIIDDSKPAFIVTNNQLAKDLSHHKNRLITVPDESAHFEIPPMEQHSQQLAYIIYTSGSTGVPNGVLIEHRGVINLALNTAKELKVSSQSRLLQLNSPCFDTSVQEWSLALLNGATLVVPKPDELPPFKELGQLISEKSISHLNAPPYVLENVTLQDFPHLEVIISGGDVCHQALVDRWALKYHFINDYGPTETTICVSMTTCNPGIKPTIGKPHPNTKLYVLNQYGALAPIGAAGELFISGAGLARGYLNRPELMQERFIVNPFQSGDEMDSSFLYKTGDLVQWNDQGELIYLGRNDGQLKIRGYRIEPNEIENCLLNHTNVKHCVVISDKENHQKLTVFIEEKKQNQLKANDYRSYLQQKLPPFMIPNDYILVKSIPLLPNSKVDKKALVQLATSRATPQLISKKMTTEEADLIEIYAHVLNSQTLNLDSNFYAVGGDSINAIHLTTLMHQKGYSFSPFLVDRYPTIRELAKYIKKSDALTFSVTLPNQLFKLSPIQQWFFERSLANPHHYNQAIMLGRTEPYDEHLLKLTLDELLKRHDTMRLRFKQKKREWLQFFADDKKAYSMPVQFYDLSNLNALEKKDRLADYCNLLHASLNIEQGPMHAIACFSGLDNPKYQLFWVSHHLVCDNVTWYLLITDFKKIYTTLEQNKAAVLSSRKKNAHFAIWVQQLQHYAKKVYSRQIEYWLNTSKNIQSLPFDLKPDSFTQADMHHLDVCLTPERSKLLLTSGNVHLRTSPVELILASLLSAFNQWKGLKELSIEMEGHGREPIYEHNDANQVTGWFTSLYPVHFNPNDYTQIQNLIIYIKNYLRQIPDKGIGYGALCYLLPNPQTKKLKQAIRPSLSFNYMGVMDNQARDQFSLIETDTSTWVSSVNHSDYPLAINCYFINHQFKLQMSYSKKHFSPNSMHRLQNTIAQELERILIFSSTVKDPIYACSDFPLIHLSQKALTQLTQNKEIESIYPLSNLQQGLLFHSTAKDDPYVAQLYWNISSSINQSDFKKAWRTLIEENAVLRTSFHQIESSPPLQIVHKTASLDWHEYDWTGLSESQFKRKLTQLLAKDKTWNFDLQQPGCMRFYYIHTNRDYDLFIWSHHHIILDGWSINLLLKQLDYLNQDSDQQRIKSFAKLSPFKNYIEWLVQQSREKAIDYWKDILKDFTKPTHLLIHNKIESVKKSNHVSLPLPEKLLNQCELFCQKYAITLNSLIHAAWSLVMAKYSNNEDLLFGMTVSGRNVELQGIENMVGLLINTLPIRVQLKKDILVIDLIQTLHQQIRDAQEYGHVSLSEIQDIIDWKKDVPLFQYISVFENYPQHKEGLLLKGEINEETHYPLSFVFSHQEQLTLTAIFDSSCFEAQYVKSLLNHVSNCLKNMIEAEHHSIQSIDMLSEKEKIKILTNFNSPFTAKLPLEMNIVSVFDHICLNYPDNIALSYEQYTVSYSKLQQKMNQFSSYINTRCKDKFTIETPIPLLLEKGINQILAILSVLKLGCMYVPIDSSLPQARIESILAQTESQLVICDHFNLNKLKNITHSLINIDDDWEMQSIPQMAFPGLNNNNLAYMIFTSGTTGKPKGIMIEHKSVINYVNWMVEELELRTTDRFMQTSSYGFDASIWELFVPLLTGAQLCIPGPNEQNDFSSLVQWMQRNQISIAQFVPSLLPLLLDTVEFENLSELRYLCAGGEELSYNLVKLIQERKNIELVNLYGPTEVTIDATFKRINRNNLAQCNPVPIGRPLSNTQVLILDQYNQLMPVGIPGELCVSGIGLARGYFQNESLTNNSFIDNPFKEKKCDYQKSLYKTGDLACWQPDGDIKYLGRKDNQVKIRGNRIELSEIKEHVLELGRIKEVALIFIEEEQIIIAFCKEEKTSRQPIDSYVKEKLSRIIPHYMIPAKSIAIEQFPLNSNDKIDYERLKTIYHTSIDLSQQHYYVKNSIIADSLNSIWKRIFKTNDIHYNSNFYELGGHSLKAMQLALQIKNYLQINCPVTSIFKHPKFSDLVNYLSKQKLKQINFDTPLLTQINSKILSAEQKRIWFLSQINSEMNQSYNMVLSFTLQGHLDKTLFENSLNQIIQNNEILRATFHVIDQELIQKIDEHVSNPLEIISIENEQHLNQLIQDAVSKPFDLKQKCWNPLLLRVSDKKYIFLLIMHHIIGDGLSLKIMMEELANSYNHPEKIPPKLFQYHHYIAWQQQFLATAAAQEQLLYWNNKLAHYEPLALPYKTNQLNQSNFDSRHIKFIIEKNQFDQIKLMCDKESCTPFIFMYTLLNTLLYKFTLQTDIILGLPISQRHFPNSETIMGCLLNTLVLRNQFSKDDSFITLLHSSKKLCLEAYDNQFIPFEQIIQSISVKREPLRNPLIQVFVNWHTSDESINLHLNNIDVNSYEVPLNLAKFDLNFTFTETKNQLTIELEYNKNLFTHHLMHQMKTGFRNLLTAVIKDETISLSKISLLTKSQEHNLVLSNTLSTPFDPPTDDLFDLLYKQVSLFPEKIALKHGEEIIRYKELYQHSIQFSQRFSENGTIIAVILDRGINMVISLLAILASENAFLLIDPEITPIKRIQEFLKQGEVKTIISSDRHIDILKHLDTEAYRIVKFEDFNPDTVSSYTDNLVRKTDKLAYIIFTSGTTNQSKAIKITHINLINHLFWRQSLFKLTHEDIFLQKTNCSFDACIWEFFLPLMLGSSSVIVDSKQYKHPDYLLQIIKSEKVTIAQFAPSMLELVLQSRFKNYLAQLQHLCLGGEVLSRQLYKKCRSLYKNNLYNLYGPAEATIDVSYYHAPVQTLKSNLPIGIPVSNVNLYVLDEGLNPVPKGTIGELAISGYAVGDGYLNNSELTAEKFIKNPFYQNHEPKAYSRLYLSGDLVRMNQENNIEFICRKDRQVKFHGIRIDLREIEYYLELHEKIESCRVVYYEHKDRQYLISFLVSKEAINLSPRFWKKYLEHFIPEYMQPSYYFSLAKIPYTINGKMDEQQLRNTAQAYFSDAPESIDSKDDLVMRQLKKIWSKVLGHHHFMVQDDFFLVGGDSILAVHLVNQINDQFRSTFPITWAFTHSTLVNQGEALRPARELSYTPVTQLNSNKTSQKLFIMHSGTGGAEVYYSLASAVNNFSVYGLEPYNFYHPETMKDNIADLAAYYVQMIQTQQKNGPYYLAGWSLGGLIAFEVAHQLKQRNDEIVYIYLFDSFLYDAYTAGQITQFYKTNINNQILIEELMRQTGLAQNQQQKMVNLMMNNCKMIEQFVPKYYDGKVILFKANQKERFNQDHFSTAYIDTLYQMHDMNDNGWSPWVKQLEIRQVNCNHMTLLTDAHCVTIAQHIDETASLVKKGAYEKYT